MRKRKLIYNKVSLYLKSDTTWSIVMMEAKSCLARLVEEGEINIKFGSVEDMFELKQKVR